MDVYYRAIPNRGPGRPEGAQWLAGGWCWFDRVELLRRGTNPQIITLDECPAEVLERMSQPRAPLCGSDWTQPWIMGVLNVTPDSFSDGGVFHAAHDALEHARAMVADGADLIDIGGESTRPGAETVPVETEIARTKPVIAALSQDLGAPISIDTRKAPVAAAALEAGAVLINDISGLCYDPAVLQLAVDQKAPVCLMHSAADPKVMQQNPNYDDALLDIYDFFSAQIAHAGAAGLPRNRIILDPGIGFGKTLAHNLALLSRFSLFHSLGCPLLIGVSRKSFIGKLSGVESAADRVPGSVAAALAAVSSGAQILRVHDVAATRQALSVYSAVITGQEGSA